MSEASTARRNGPEAGVTLLEVLVSLALAAMIFSIVLTSVRTGLASYRGQLAAAEREDTLDRGLAVLAADISRCRPLVNIQNRTYLFSGLADQMTCALAERPQAGGPGLAFIRFVVASTTGEGAAATSSLVRMRAPAATTFPVQADWRDAVSLLSGPFAITFRYVDPTGSVLTRWRDSQRMPAAVELSVRTTSGQEVAGPLRVTLMADMEAECSLGGGPYCRIPTGRLGGSAAE